jgi:atypical dual specificity phosphatase
VKNKLSNKCIKPSLAGISRSTTLVISYIMTISELPWYDSLNAVRAARKGANPNFGFQRQLQNFEYTTLKAVYLYKFKLWSMTMSKDFDFN